MENSDGGLEEGVRVGEVSGVEEGSSESRSANGESRVSDDNKTKDSEADEVFEEAVGEEVNTPARREEGKREKESDSKVLATDGNASEENFVERIVNVDPRSGHEMEHFEEADEVPTVHEKSENGASDHVETDGVAGGDTIEVPVLRVDEEVRAHLSAKLPAEGFESEDGKVDGGNSSVTCFLVQGNSENADSEAKVEKNEQPPEIVLESSENEDSVVKLHKNDKPSGIVCENPENEDSDVKVDKNDKSSEIQCSEQVCSSVDVDFDKKILHHDQIEIVEEMPIGADRDNDEKIGNTQVETSLSEGEIVEETSVSAGTNTDISKEETSLSESGMVEETSSATSDCSAGKKIDNTLEEASLSPELGTEVGERNEATENDRGHAIDSQANRLAVNQGGESDHPEIINHSGDSRPVDLPHNPEEKGTAQASLLENPAGNRLSEGDSVSIKEHDESLCTHEENTESVKGASCVKPADAPPPRPAGLGSSAPLLGTASRISQQPRGNGTMQHQQAQTLEESANGETEEYDETREKLQMIRVKFLRLAHRLGQTPHNVVVSQVLYRLGLAEQLSGSRTTSRAGAFSFDRASAMAVQLETAVQGAIDFSCTIMVLGKSGVGKSATINSIFDENRFTTDAFQPSTKKVQDITGTVQGIKVRVIDTPGLLPSSADLHRNRKILHSVKQFIKKTPPDIVLYLDRLDMPSTGDLPLLRTITDIFGPSIWFNAIVVLTHAASAPPDGSNGNPLSYELFVTHRSHEVQKVIRQAAGDQRLMNPVSLVENHSACRTNRAGQRVLPNGQVWKPQLLLLSFASKILAEANTLLKLQDSPMGKPFGTRPRVPPLPFLLSSLLQSRPQLKLPEEQFGEDDNADEDLDEASDSEAESEYDELPPFKRLTKSQLAQLSRAQKKAYYDELEYREKLFMKKQLKEEKRRRKLLKKMAEAVKDLPNDYNENEEEEESGGAASVPVPMPDLALPTSFDSDNPTHRYRCLDSSNQWLVRPVLENHGWDHDVGYEGINVERLFVVKDKLPVSCSGQLMKDKKEFNLQMEVASSVKHGEGKATSVGLDMQSVGKDMAYTFRSETKFSNFKRNKMAAGISVTMLGDALTAGVKLEDVLVLHKRLRVVTAGGAMTCRGDVAYGGSLEATLRDKDYPLGRTLSTLGLSVMDWHGDLATGCNIQSQFPVGRNTNMVARANLSNKGSGQVSLRLSSSELQIGLLALVPIVRRILWEYGYVYYS
ncbi:hypothetical protein H6P81_018455 [Aristolochia fimbriata]|uniref:AIG1-type G domain-containing protein n=1 Tax=Aristolochia fimbriata TaxID=158543 RepID=A0AAV7E449_ARIFI|nr:hypothetical protein H6P81_018455 [Aristolochia fimbriata]